MDYDAVEASDLIDLLETFQNNIEQYIDKARECQNSLGELHPRTLKYYQHEARFSFTPERWYNSVEDIIINIKNIMSELSGEDRTSSLSDKLDLEEIERTKGIELTSSISTGTLSSIAKKLELEEVDRTEGIELSSQVNKRVIGIVQTDHSNLNVRTSPNGQITGSLPKGTELHIVGESEDGKWYKIKLENGEEGYVYKEYVEVPKDAPSTEGVESIPVKDSVGVVDPKDDYPTEYPYKGLVDTEKDNLNVRTGPNGQVIESLPKGTNLVITGESEDGKWFKVNYGDGKEGYVYKEYIIYW